MPWAIEHRGDEWCVVKEEGGKVEGCHASRDRALAQQRALYATEKEMTAAVVHPPTPRYEIAAAPQRIEVTTTDPVVGEALVAAIENVSLRLQKTEDLVARALEVMERIVVAQNVDREAFTAALTASVNNERVITVNVPDILIPEQPPATVNVHVPKSKILIPAQPTPVVNVTMPGSRKTVKFTRNLNGEVEQAEIQEELE
jgi:predicted protein tyrosine phosphatase